MQKPFIDPVAGYEFEPTTLRVETQYQTEKLEVCGLDPKVLAGHVDISFFIGLGIQFGIQNGISAEGNVNMLQQLAQTRPVHLDEELTVHGYIREVQPVPRGRIVDTKVWFEDQGGIKVVDASRRSLKPDPELVGAKGAGERPGPALIEPWQKAADYQLTPEEVVAYSSEGNSIHYEPEAAAKAGFRAPIIGGGMGVHYLMHALWSQGIPQEINLDIYFRRPIFWDHRFSVVFNDTALGLISEDGKVLTEAKISKH